MQGNHPCIWTSFFGQVSKSLFGYCPGIFYVSIGSGGHPGLFFKYGVKIVICSKAGHLSNFAYSQGSISKQFLGLYDSDLSDIVIYIISRNVFENTGKNSWKNSPAALQAVLHPKNSYRNLQL